MVERRIIPALDLDCQPDERPATPADPWLPPWPNEAAGRVQHNGTPPDLSLITKARKNGAAYVAAFLDWAAEPAMDNRLRAGTLVLTYLVAAFAGARLLQIRIRRRVQVC